MGTQLTSSLDIVYADHSLIVVNKPAGLLAVPGRGVDKTDCVSRRVQLLYSDALVVHRLDQATSGLMLMARGVVMQRSVSLLFETRKIRKTYAAVANGLVQPDEGDIDLPIAADWPARPRQKIDSILGKKALTHFRVISRDVHSHTTRLELTPVTGRTHQLRVHLWAIGHPLLGDTLYYSDHAHINSTHGRLHLHAEHLALTHPESSEVLRWHANADF